MTLKAEPNFRYAIYTRMLTGRSPRTLAQYKSRTEEFLKDIDPFNIVEYQDEFCSDDLERSPGLDQLLYDAEQGRFQIVVLTCTQMFGSSIYHFKSMAEILEEYWVAVVAMSRLSTLKNLPTTPMASGAFC